MKNNTLALRTALRVSFPKFLSSASSAASRGWDIVAIGSGEALHDVKGMAHAALKSPRAVCGLISYSLKTRELAHRVLKAPPVRNGGI